MTVNDHRNKIKSKAISFVEQLNSKVYILGTNNYGLCTANWITSLGFDLVGFINDFENNPRFGIFNVFKSNEIPNNISIINCITEGRVIIAEESINKIKPISHIDYFALQLAFPEQLIEINFLEDTNCILKNIEEYIKLYDQLADIQSKTTFESITNFRLNRDIDYLKIFQFKIKDQYFEPFINLSSNPIFIDGGGFDGGTSKTFVNLYPQYSCIYYFEPNEFAFLNSKEELNSLLNIHFIQKGLWSKSDTLVFDNSLGNASKLTSLGSIKIETTTIDSIINSKTDFIKFDIEGAEYEALIGSKQLIKTHKPALAICVYHNQIDFIRIPQLILSLRPDYKIYLRHYTQGVCETVMYFV